jgi:ATP-dependent DNA helicase RecG
MGISELLRDDETENVEFKTSLSEMDEILKTISAFPIKGVERS